MSASALPHVTHLLVSVQHLNDSYKALYVVAALLQFVKSRFGMSKGD